MPMNQLNLSFTPFTTVVLAFSLCSCDLLDHIKGNNSLSAKIDGVFISFQDVMAQNYMGISIRSLSRVDQQIWLHLYYPAVGGHSWGGYTGQFSSGTQASWKGLPSVDSVGGFRIDVHDHSNNHIVGSFNFIVIDSARLDTIHVTDGRFDCYYTNED